MGAVFGHSEAAKNSLADLVVFEDSAQGPKDGRIWKEGCFKDLASSEEFSSTCDIASEESVGRIV